MSKFILISLDGGDRMCNAMSHKVFDTKEEAQAQMRKEVEDACCGDEEWEEIGWNGYEDGISSNSALIPAEVTGEDDDYWEIIEVA